MRREIELTSSSCFYTKRFARFILFLYISKRNLKLRLRFNKIINLPSAWNKYDHTIEITLLRHKIENI